MGEQEVKAGEIEAPRDLGGHRVRRGTRPAGRIVGEMGVIRISGDLRSDSSFCEFDCEQIGPRPRYPSPILVKNQIMEAALPSVGGSKKLDRAPFDATDRDSYWLDKCDVHRVDQIGLDPCAVAFVSLPSCRFKGRAGR